jgi:hypothetical protein
MLIINEKMVSSYSVSSQNIILNGYFQNRSYFVKWYESICRMIRLEQQREKIKSEYDYNFENSVSMHFRLGDYLSLPEHYIILPYEYYKNSLDMIYKRDNSIEIIYYFCEESDIDAVMEIIDKLICNSNIKFIRISPEIEDWKQLLLMSCCKHNIIANSTFSWWGAYFNSNPDKIVCSPSQWYGPKINNNIKDLIPEEWILHHCAL